MGLRLLRTGILYADFRKCQTAAPRATKPQPVDHSSPTPPQAHRARPRRSHSRARRRVGGAARGHDQRREPSARLHRRLRNRARPASGVLERTRTHRGAGTGEHPAGGGSLPGLRGQPALHGKPPAPGGGQRRAHPRGPRRGHGSGAVPTRTGAASARPAAPAHPRRGRRGPRQDAGSGHSGERTHRPRPWPAHSRIGGEKHARAIPERVLEPLHHRPHTPRFRRHSARAAQHSRQPQSVPLLRQDHHLHRHAEAGRGIPHLLGERLLGHHRHRRSAQRRGPRHHFDHLAAQPPGETALAPLGHPHHALRHAPRRPGTKLRQLDEHAGRNCHCRPGRLRGRGLPRQRAGDPPLQERHTA